ncbi:Na+/H+ antiporter NhaA [Kineosporia sp. A_224]|uniref:Na+/H+ antiporter NhaA n=1 Tax=Kineosporia sp. A_224 TaxID=1962180 RepID=UPI000B4A8E34|nr:Na+/H+ antiporter NhaA [Kineosporia sp. A_224]
MTLPTPGRAVRRIFDKVTDRERTYVADILRTETVGGALLLAGALIALVWANSPWREGYSTMLGTTLGPAWLDGLHLRLDVAAWAADGLLAIFFFVAGVELKRELVAGDLRDPAKAALPVVAAICGVLLPAGVYLAFAAGESGTAQGWAIPVATDIAFALAVLAVLGSHLPTALRSFLLTLAVVDDLIAITIIAVAYTSDLALLPLAGALVPLAAFALVTRRGITTPWLLVPLAVTTWALVHASGVHATVAGVLLGFAVPVVARAGEEHSIGEHLEHVVRPLSAGVAVPVFALTAAGVTVVGGGFGEAVRDPVFVGITVALVLGKAVGVLGGTWLTARFTRAELSDDLDWSDVLAVSLLAGIGFTVSLLIGELAFGAGSERDDHVKAAVLTGSLVAAALAAVVLRRRDRHYRLLAEAEARDAAGAGQPAGQPSGQS